MTRLCVPPAELAQPLGVSFEQVSDAWGRLPRMFLEPDGSFVWVAAEQDGTRWQVDGVLIDGGDRLQYVELKGCCPPAAFGQLLGPLRGVSGTLLVQLVRQAIHVEEVEFQRFQFGG